MRLIDADKEIKNFKNKIKSEKKELEWILENMPDHVNRIKYLQEDIHNCRYFISLLSSFETAYDLDKLMDGLNKILRDEISQPVADCVYECVQQGYW